MRILQKVSKVYQDNTERGKYNHISAKKYITTRSDI
jgi:hypothetical protein